VAEPALSSRRSAAYLLVTSYVLLVAVTVAGAFWIQEQFDQAQAERCDLLVIQIKLAQLEVILLRSTDSTSTPTGNADIDARVHAIRDRVQNACPDADLPA
jgi:hypothetical protein